MQTITRLISVLFLFSLASFAFNLKIKAGEEQSGFGYFIIRSEWDDRCVAYINGQLILVKDCQMGQAVWEGAVGQTRNIAIKNYYTGKYLGFQPGIRLPQMLGNSANNLAKWDFIPVHGHNRRWPHNRSYWHITYHVIQNIGTRLCLMVNGDTVSQLNCNPGKPEHLSFEEVKFNPVWKKSPERVAEEKKAAPKPEVVPPTKVFPGLYKPAKNPTVKKPVISIKPAPKRVKPTKVFPGLYKPAKNPTVKKPVISIKPAPKRVKPTKVFPGLYKPAKNPTVKKPVISIRPAPRPFVPPRKVHKLPKKPTGKKPVPIASRKPKKPLPPKPDWLKKQEQHIKNEIEYWRRVNLNRRKPPVIAVNPLPLKPVKLSRRPCRKPE